MNTRDTAVRVHGILRCAKVTYRTRTRDTRFGNTAGKPIPVAKPSWWMKHLRLKGRCGIFLSAWWQSILGRLTPHQWYVYISIQTCMLTSFGHRASLTPSTTLLRCHITSNWCVKRLRLSLPKKARLKTPLVECIKLTASSRKHSNLTD